MDDAGDARIDVAVDRIEAAVAHADADDARIGVAVARIEPDFASALSPPEGAKAGRSRRKTATITRRGSSWRE